MRKFVFALALTGAFATAASPAAAALNATKPTGDGCTHRVQAPTALVGSRQGCCAATACSDSREAVRAARTILRDAAQDNRPHADKAARTTFRAASRPHRQALEGRRPPSRPLGESPHGAETATTTLRTAASGPTGRPSPPH